MDDQVLKVIAALFLSYLSNGMYVVDVLKGEVKPHLFSWVTWSILMGIAAAVAFAGGAYASGIIITNGCAMTLLIAVLSFWHGEKNIIKTDYIMFGLALTIIPVWAVTKEPLHAAMLVTLIDLLGFGPTFRKAWNKPQEESMRAFVLYCLIWVLNVAAVKPYVLTTGLYPTTILCANVTLTLMLLLRRRRPSVKASVHKGQADTSAI